MSDQQSSKLSEMPKMSDVTSNPAESVQSNSKPVVVNIVDHYQVAINRGSAHGVKLHDKFMIYRLSKEPVVDPTTGENLGHLEIVIGRGTAVHVQEKMTTIKSTQRDDSTKFIKKSISLLTYGNTIEEREAELLRLDVARVGDLVRQI